VTLKEADLMFVRRTRDVRVRPLDREVVEDGALVDRSLGLRDQLGAPHVTVPLRRAVDCDLRALLAAGIAAILEVGREVHVFGDGARSVDVVLIVCEERRYTVSDLVASEMDTDNLLPTWFAHDHFSRSALELISLKRPSQRMFPGLH
jgi:hypothetical protein